MGVPTRRIVVGRGKAQVEVDPQLARVVNRVLDKGLRHIVRPMEVRRDQVMREAATKWPKRTGRSLDGFRGPVRVDPAKGEVEVLITNDVPYVYFIRTRRVRFQRRQHAWTTFILRPGRRAGKVLAEELGDELVKLSRGRA